MRIAGDTAGKAAIICLAHQEALHCISSAVRSSLLQVYKHTLHRSNQLLTQNPSRFLDENAIPSQTPPHRPHRRRPRRPPRLNQHFPLHLHLQRATRHSYNDPRSRLPTRRNRRRNPNDTQRLPALDPLRRRQNHRGRFSPMQKYQYA